MNYEELCSRLKRNDPTLHRLYIINEVVSVNIFKLICQALINNTVVSILELRRTNLNDEKMYYIRQMLFYNTTIETLIFSENNPVSSEGIKFLSQALVKNKTLWCLDLSYNILNLEAIKYLAQALSINSTLGSLYLNECHIDNKMSEYVAEILFKNTSITMLDLGKNYIRNGFKIISRALIKNTTLNTLNLSYNDLNYKSAKYLGPVLKFNSTLTEIDIEDNDFGSGCRYLVEALAYNSILTSLDICNSGYATLELLHNDEDHEEIIRLMNRNRHNYIERNRRLFDTLFENNN